MTKKIESRESAINGMEQFRASGFEELPAVPLPSVAELSDRRIRMRRVRIASCSIVGTSAVLAAWLVLPLQPIEPNVPAAKSVTGASSPIASLESPPDKTPFRVNLIWTAMVQVAGHDTDAEPIDYRWEVQEMAVPIDPALFEPHVRNLFQRVLHEPITGGAIEL